MLNWGIKYSFYNWSFSWSPRAICGESRFALRVCSALSSVGSVFALICRTHPPSPSASISTSCDSCAMPRCSWFVAQGDSRARWACERSRRRLGGLWWVLSLVVRASSSTICFCLMNARWILSRPRTRCRMSSGAWALEVELAWRFQHFRWDLRRLLLRWMVQVRLWWWLVERSRRSGVTSPRQVSAGRFPVFKEILVQATA